MSDSIPPNDRAPSWKGRVPYCSKDCPSRMGDFCDQLKEVAPSVCVPVVADISRLVLLAFEQSGHSELCPMEQHPLETLCDCWKRDAREMGDGALLDGRTAE